MVNGTERDREFVTHLKSKASRLCKADVMGVSWRSFANETGLLGDKTQMFLGSDPLWFADGKHTLVDLCASTVMTWLFHVAASCPLHADQPRSEVSSRKL